ncbi:MAG: DUF2332 domain-containing protein [Ilumatobacter sp.]
MSDPSNLSEIQRQFSTHADTAFSRAPLNAALAACIARDASLYSLLAHAPNEQQLPVLLLAAIHSLVLREPTAALAEWYPNISAAPRRPDDPALCNTLASFVSVREAEVKTLVERRTVQTNEIGRCSLLLPALALVDAELGPLAHLDVGASAGLNTLLTSFSYRYDDGPRLGDGGPVLSCSTRGTGPVPRQMPRVTTSRGLDPNPLDVTTDDDATWLRACCWPDQADRFERLSQAVRIACSTPPDVRVANAVDDVRAHLLDLAQSGHPIVTTSWVLNYLSPHERNAFMTELDAVGHELDLSWVFAESPALTPELGHHRSVADEHTTALALVRWRQGRRSIDHLGVCHPHGYWLHWQ